MKSCHKFIMMKKTLYLALIFLGGFIIPEAGKAQWSGDPFENLMVRDTAGLICVPHVIVNEDGNSFISWYSATEGLRFDVYLQYFDQQGNKQWPEPGLLISNHETNTWVSDYDLAMDQEGCAILVTQDLRDGYSNSFAYRITPEGQMKWGPDGIRITDGDDENYTPQVIVTPDNDYIFLNNMCPKDTTQMWRLNLKKVSKEGNILWDKTLSADMMDLYFGRMLITEDKALMLSYLLKDNYPDTTLGQEHYVHVFLQKFDLDGNSPWPAPVQADTGDVMMYGALYTIPYLANDGANGAYVIWQSFVYDNPSTLANHIDADGNPTWPGHGIPVSTNYANYHTAPSACYNSTTDNLFVFWDEYHYDDIDLEDCWGVAGQKFSPDGERLWSDTAKLLVPLICATDTALMGVHLSAGPDNSMFITYDKDYLMISGTDTSNASNIFGCLIDDDGNCLWQDQKVPVSLASGEKSHCYVSDFSADQWIIAWEDNRNHGEDPWNSGIYAQNVTIDGNLGSLSIKEINTSKSGSIRTYPNPFTDEINMDYSLDHASSVTVELFDNLGRCLETIDLGLQDAGKHQYILFGKKLNPGIYFLTLQAEEIKATIKIVKCH
jgi:hypothetical protein